MGEVSLTAIGWSGSRIDWLRFPELYARDWLQDTGYYAESQYLVEILEQGEPGFSEGYGDGDGDGDGYGYGDGVGNGQGYGNGYGNWYGNGNGDGAGYGRGKGDGIGYGGGYGIGSE